MEEPTIDWSKVANIRGMDNFARREPKYDVEVSKIVGKPVLATDPRLLRLVVKHKRQNNSNENNENMHDDFLNSPAFLVELKEVFK